MAPEMGIDIQAIFVRQFAPFIFTHQFVGVFENLIPLGLGLFLLTKPTTSLSWLGSLSVAFLLGVGAALAIGGALLAVGSGTLA